MDPFGILRDEDRRGLEPAQDNLRLFYFKVPLNQSVDQSGSEPLHARSISDHESELNWKGGDLQRDGHARLVKSSVLRDKLRVSVL